MVTRAALVVLIVVAVGFAWSRHERRVRDEARWSGIASAIVGHPVRVRCPDVFRRLTDVSGEAGTVRFGPDGAPAPATDLSPETCDGLARFARTRTISFENAWAVQTLAHETFHLRGIRDEAVTECYGLQWTAFVAARLGASPAQAGAIARVAWSAGFADLPAEYRSPDCRDGGRLDLRSGTSAWP